MDHNFTAKVQEWLYTPAESRDYEQGALYLLQLTNNQILYRNLSRNTKKNAEVIEYQLRKYMKFRLADVTHSEVREMQAKVDQIAALHNLTASAAETPDSGEMPNSNDASRFRAGQREDHDALPAEIQACYTENATIMHKMRELHLRLRTLSVENATCPDSERYPFLKELIALDKQYHKNWQIYDSYSADAAAANAEQQLMEDERMRQKNIYRQINLTKGRYKKNPSDSLKEQISGLYAQLTSPVETLTAELVELGILPTSSSTVPEESSSVVEEK